MAQDLNTVERALLGTAKFARAPVNAAGVRWLGALPPGADVEKAGRRMVRLGYAERVNGGWMITEAGEAAYVDSLRRFA